MSWVAIGAIPVGEKISGGISKFVTISHVALDDDDGGLDRRGGDGSSASMVLSADGVSEYRTKFNSCDFLDEV